MDLNVCVQHSIGFHVTANNASIDLKLTIFKMKVEAEIFLNSLMCGQYACLQLIWFFLNLWFMMRSLLERIQWTILIDDWYCPPLLTADYMYMCLQLCMHPCKQMYMSNIPGTIWQTVYSNNITYICANISVYLWKLLCVSSRFIPELREREKKTLLPCWTQSQGKPTTSDVHWLVYSPNLPLWFLQELMFQLQSW